MKYRSEYLFEATADAMASNRVQVLAKFKSPMSSVRLKIPSKISFGNDSKSTMLSFNFFCLGRFASWISRFGSSARVRFLVVLSMRSDVSSLSGAVVDDDDDATGIIWPFRWRSWSERRGIIYMTIK